MGNQLLASKVTIEEEAPSLRSMPTVDTAVAGFVGVTEKGPVGEATLVTSLTEFNRIFGGWTADAAEMVAAVQGYFQNGGSQLYIVRQTIYASGVSSATKATVNLLNATPVATLRVDGKYVGTYAAAYRVVVAAASNGLSTDFNLEVRDASGIVIESFPNLTMDVTALRYVVRVVNDSNSGSSRIMVTDLAVSGTTTARRPANVGATALVGGTDALPSSTADWVGTEADGNGIYAFDTADDLTMMAMPGQATKAIQLAMLAYAEVNRSGQIFVILDPPLSLPPTGTGSIEEYVWGTVADPTLGLNTQTEFGAMYWPNITISNPSRAVFGTVEDIIVPPSGHIAGVFARTDGARAGGVWDPPAGTEAGRLVGVTGFENRAVLKEAIRDRLFPRRINPLTALSGYGRFIDGARTLKGDGNFPTVAQRRGVSFVERTVKLGLQFARHKNNNEELRSMLTRTIWAFLKGQTDLGAFASRIPDEAFFVDFGEALNPPTSPNIVVGRVGLATVQPAEFIRLLFSQDTRAVDALLQG